MFEEEKRNDAEVQGAIRALFLGLAPERASELEQLWEDYSLQFCLFGDDKGVVLEGGAYRYVHFNHRALRVIWVAAFAAWEAYAYAQSAFDPGEMRSLDRLRGLLELAHEVRDAPDPEAVSLCGLPQPGELSVVPELRAPAELAMFATGWALLHEVRHLKHQQDGTSTPQDASPEFARQEELSCDKFAADYLLSTAGEYARAHSQSEADVQRKRALGIYFGMFAIIVIGHPHWTESASHPSVSRRLQAMRQALSSNQLDEALCIAALALAGLKEVWPSAPDFVG